MTTILIQQRPVPPALRSALQAAWDENYTKLGPEWEMPGPNEPYGRPFREEALKIAGNKPLRVLDVGTVVGFLAQIYADLGHEVTGIDVSSVAIASAKSLAAKRGYDIRFLEAFADQLPFEDDSFDLVVNRVVLWATPDPEAAMREWVRVTRPGGQIASWTAGLSPPLCVSGGG